MVDDGAPGWDAIDGALRTLYPAREPKHYGTIVKWMLGGPDPLDGISAYASSANRPHWHFVSYGLSELYEKKSADPTKSGYGFELTFRLARQPNESEPPPWALNFLQNLARYVFETGNAFAPGHHMNLNGPIAMGVDTAITAALFATDPELPTLETPHGTLQFIQIVGITLDELEAVQSWNSVPFTALLCRDNPLLVTELDRHSILDAPMNAREVEAGIARDGSSMSELYVSMARWSREAEGTRLTLGGLAAAGVKQQLAGRLGHGRPLLVFGANDDAAEIISFRPGETAGLSFADEGGYLILSIPVGLAREMHSSLEVKRGEYSWSALPSFVIEVVPSVIKDADGKPVRTVG